MEILTGNMNRLKNILVFLSLSFLVLSLYSCSSKSDQEPQVDEEVQPSVPVQKKILYSQRTQGGKNAINVIEEQQGHKRTLRIIVQRGDLNSNLVHPIDSPNFVIAIPLQDATSKQFAEQTVLFEQQLKKDVDSVLGRYLAPERFNVSLLVQWNQKLLEEIQRIMQSNAYNKCSKSPRRKLRNSRSSSTKEIKPVKIYARADSTIRTMSNQT